MDNEDYYPGYEVEADPQWIGMSQIDFTLCDSSKYL